MNINEIIKRVANELNLSETKTKKVFKEIMEQVTEEILHNEEDRVTIVGIGSFYALNTHPEIDPHNKKSPCYRTMRFKLPRSKRVKL